MINVASRYGLLGVPSEAAYVTSKHAVIRLMKAVALEWALNGVHENALCPGFIETDMLISATGDEETAAFLRRMTPSAAGPSSISSAARPCSSRPRLRTS